MPAYGVAQAGYNVGANLGLNLRAVYPGDDYVLFNAETVATGSASVAFVRAMAPGATQTAMTFSIDWAATPTGSTAVIQASNTDLDADYVTVGTFTANAQHDVYTDVAQSAFYRAKVTTYAAGGACTVKVQR
jgi:hypothetical protein